MKTGLARSVFIASLTAVGSWQAYSFAVKPFLRLSSPDLLIKSGESDAASLSKRVQRKIQKAGKYVSDASDARVAQNSLVYAPLSRSSLRIIGMHAAITGNAKTAVAALALAHRVSRRDPWTEAWLLERAAKNNDFGSILAHYNAALSVHPELAPGLNPILAKAIAHPQVRTALAPYLRDNASWTSGFLMQAATASEVADVFSLIMPVAHHLSDEQYIPALSQIIFQLAVDGRSTDAAKLASATWPDFDLDEFQSSTPNKATSDKRLGRLAWSFGDSPGLTSHLLKDQGFETTLAPLSRGAIANRTFAVHSGEKYSLTQKIAFDGNWQDARISWRAHCVLPSGSETHRVLDKSIPFSKKQITYRTVFSTPEGCSLLHVSLDGNGPDGQSEAIFVISSIYLTLQNK